MDDQQLGELIGTVRAIKENTDKIPQLAISVALHEARISDMEPKVEQHETNVRRALVACCVSLAGIVASLFRSHAN